MNIESWIRIIILIVALIFFGFALFFALEDNFKAVTAFLAMGMLCFVLVLLSKFKRFKGFGFEAELWEAKQEEAAHLVSTLRSLAIIVSEQLLTLSARSGRWNSATPRNELHALRERLDDILKKIDVSKDQRDLIAANFFRYTAIDMVSPVIENINEFIRKKRRQMEDELKNPPQPLDSEGLADLSAKVSQVNLALFDWNEYHRIADQPEIVEHIITNIRDIDFLSDEEKVELLSKIKDELEDLKEWIVNKNLRRRDFWFSSDPMK